MKPDLDNHSNVAVINADLATEVLGRRDVVGENVKFNGKKFLVIGVLKEKNSSAGISSSSTLQAYIPYTS